VGNPGGARVSRNVRRYGPESGLRAREKNVDVEEDTKGEARFPLAKQ